MMNRREIFARLMKREDTPRTLFDLCGTPMTLMNHDTIGALAERLRVKANDEAEVKENVLIALGADFRMVGDILQTREPRYNADRTRFVDSWGVVRGYTGLYWDIVEYPLKGATVDDLHAYPWPDAKDVDRALIAQWKEQAKRLHEDTDYVVVASHPVYGVLELGCWMCGFDDFLYRLIAEPEFVDTFFHYVYRYSADVISEYYAALGDCIHVTTSGDDFGTQNGPFMSPALFGEMIVPWYKKRIALTQSLTKAYYFHHTCGSVHGLIPHIIDMGADILNPVQPGAYMMEPERLVEDYGGKMIFWGGIDEQGLLTEGTPGGVAAEVRRIAGVFGNGWIAAPSHNIQPDVPIENIIAMANALR